jgi:carbon starvation protein
LNALPLVLVILGIFAVAYRYYSAFLASRAFALDDRNITPAHRFNDGHNYVPSPRWVVFGHHFAAIAGAGPLVGPTLAAQFGYAPGLLWLVAGAVLAGTVHDMTMLIGSMRHDGRSLPHIVLSEVGPVTGMVALIAVVIDVVIAMAGLAIVVVNALSQSAWSLFTIGMTIPIAFIMGWWMFRSRPGRVLVLVPSLFGIVALAAALIAGHAVASSAISPVFQLSSHTIILILCAYGFLASTLPVWMLLEPRDYLSTYIKIGTIAALLIGVILVHPTLQFPAFTSFVHGGGPVIPGKVFPFLFVTIACGAISGFHSLVSSGTTPKLVDKETQARFIGYGGMLMESLVGVLALIAACSMNMGDYFAINVPPAAFAKLGMQPVHLQEMSRMVGESLAGRVGGPVSFAIGMAQIFHGIPGMARLTSYWFHFAILFEAMFILTTIDAGTRVGRYVLQELMAKIHAPFAASRSLAANLIASSFIVLCWGYLVWGGSIGTIWPLFGTANQLLAAIALSTMTAWLVNHGKAAYAWLTIVPAAFVLVTTISAALLSTCNVYWPMAHHAGTETQGWVETILMIAFLAGAVIVIVFSCRRCIQTLRGVPPPFAQTTKLGGGRASQQPAAPFRCC